MALSELALASVWSMFLCTGGKVSDASSSGKGFSSSSDNVGGRDGGGVGAVGCAVKRFSVGEAVL